jgi:hypothetical protein
LNPAHTLPAYFPKIHLNIILQPPCGLSHLGFPTRMLYKFIAPCVLHVRSIDSSIWSF